MVISAILKIILTVWVPKLTVTFFFAKQRVNLNNRLYIDLRLTTTLKISEWEKTAQRRIFRTTLLQLNNIHSTVDLTYKCQSELPIGLVSPIEVAKQNQLHDRSSTEGHHLHWTYVRRKEVLPGRIPRRLSGFR